MRYSMISQGVDAKRLQKDTGYISFFYIVKKMPFWVKSLISQKIVCFTVTSFFGSYLSSKET
jgi:hypothetical protein